MTPRFGTAALAVAFSAVAPAASAAIISASGDTFVQQNAPTTNFGNSTGFTSKNDGGGGSSTTDRIGFIRFDLSGSPTPVTTATLLLNITGAGTTQTGGNPLTFTVLGIPESLTYGTGPIALENFVEGDGGTDGAPANELTFGNAPGTSTGVNGSFVRTSYTNLGTFQSTTASGPRQFTSAALVNFLNADTNGVAGFVIVRDTDDANATGFAARENLTVAGPQIFINQPVPEPGTIGLLGAGAMLALRRRKRR
ncbi:MAG TPA: DNRLRE domain-containing protein [Tepidisphaeraceae bacterium]|nr:DNRLRE domain-containing protein [Tepidisphaeraceae bacterium]